MDRFETIRSALSFVDPSDRDTWVRAAMSVKSELGDEGFEIWDAWSAQAGSYKPRDAKSVWRSVKPYGGVTARSLYAEARQHGWQGTEPPRQLAPRQSTSDDQERRRRQLAAKKAAEMVQDAALSWHPYLVRKGHSEVKGLVLNELLLVPMRDVDTDQINSCQTITATGEKKFLAGGKAKGSVFKVGPSSSEVYLCEGYATALSIKAALDLSFRRARVVVCFSAGNLAHVAKRISGYVVADHDESGTGEKYAKQTGLPWWMPPELGDANDFHLSAGLKALASALAELRIRPRVGAAAGR